MRNDLRDKYNIFWEWFEENESRFYTIIKEGKEIEKLFFDEVSSELLKIRDGFYYLTGMAKDDKVELILTADGNIKNIVFVEELIEKAPKLHNWKFFALKPDSDNNEFEVQIGQYRFGLSNLSFYANNKENYPDEIDISIIYKNLNEKNRDEITNGIHIFLDNYLGELNFATKIDAINVVSEIGNNEEIPLLKLKDYVNWREKEFVEKYSDDEYISDEYDFSMLEGKTESGETSFAVINTKVLHWENSVSHPWVASIRLNYDGSESNGMPNEEDYDLLDQIEEDILNDLILKKGTIYIGRETAEGSRNMHFVSKDFREISKVLTEVENEFKERFKIDIEVYKDKYWRSFEHFKIS